MSRTTPISQPRFSTETGPLPLILGAYALVGGAITLLGWFRGLPRLTDWSGDGIAMFANTALAAMLAGAALIVSAWGRHRYPAIRLLGGSVALIGGVTLFQHLTGQSLGIDTLLIYPEWGFRAAIAPGRMGPPASTSFVLLGVAILLSTAGPLPRRVALYFGILVSAIATLGLLGYLFGASHLYSLPRFTGIAMQTGTILLALGLGLLLLLPEYGPVAMLRDPGTAGMLCRRLLPVILIFPIVLGYFCVRLGAARKLDFGMGTALLVVGLIGLLCSVLVWCLKAVRDRETAIGERTTEIEALNARLQRAMAETHHRVKNNLQVIAALVDIRAMDAQKQVSRADLSNIGHHIQSLATIHDLLTSQIKGGEGSDSVHTKDVMDRLAPLLRTVVGSREIRFHVENMALLSRQGTSIAVLVNELVSNAVKHGDGEIEVELAVVGDRARLRISDRGPGFQNGFDPHASAGTGLQLVESVSRLDLQGSSEYSNRDGGGATVVVEFPRPQYGGNGTGRASDRKERKETRTISSS